MRDLTVIVYSSGTTPLQNDAGSELLRATGVDFETMYPAGLYGAASFFIARDVLDCLAVKVGMRVEIWDDLDWVYEGHIININYTVSRERSGVEVNCVGPWAYRLMQYALRKRWVDNRFNDDAWQPETTAQFDKFTLDRSNRLRFLPKQGVSYAANDVVYWRYDMPTGQTIKRVTFDYNLQEGAQDWGLTLYNIDAASVIWNVNVSGSGSRDETLATPSNGIWFYFNSGAAQTGIGDGTIHATITNLRVYSETGNINMYEIFGDVVDELSTAGYLNSSKSLLQQSGSPLSLVPFMADDFENIADILAEAAGRGDANYDAWGYGLKHSRRAQTYDGKSLLFLEPYPDTSDYDITVGLDERPPLISPVRFRFATEHVLNWITLRFDNAQGRSVFRSPLNNALLKDDASISTYGRRAPKSPLYLGDSTTTIADTFGRKVLSRYKDGRWELRSSLTLMDQVRTKNQRHLPVSKVEAGMRIRIENFIEDVIFLISATRYSQQDDVVTLQAGLPISLLMPRYMHPELEEEATTGESGGAEPGAQPGWHSWSKRKKYVRFGRSLGYTWSRWLGLSAQEMNRLIRAEKQRRRR